jgi:hypothetical protein
MYMTTSEDIRQGVEAVLKLRASWPSLTSRLSRSYSRRVESFTEGIRRLTER